MAELGVGLPDYPLEYFIALVVKSFVPLSLPECFFYQHLILQRDT